MNIDLVSIEGALSATAAAIAASTGLWKGFIKGWTDKNKAKKQEAADRFWSELRELRDENTQQHLSAQAAREASEARAIVTLGRMEKKQDYLVEKVDKIEDDVANVRERTAYLEGTMGTHI